MMSVAYVVVTTVHVQMNVAYQMVITHPVPISVAYPMVTTQVVLTVPEFQMAQLR